MTLEPTRKCLETHRSLRNDRWERQSLCGSACWNYLLNCVFH